MSSLKKQCGNCYRNGIAKCEPVEIPLPNYSKLDSEIERLEAQMADAEEAEEKALQALLAARAKSSRLRKQKKFLKRREHELLDASGKYVEEIEALEAAESLSWELSNLENGLMPGSLALDWAVFPPSNLDEVESTDPPGLSVAGPVASPVGARSSGQALHPTGET